MFYRYTLPNDYAKQIIGDKIKAVSYTEFENEPSLVHSHKNVTEVIFVKSGSGVIAYRDAEIKIKPNTVYIVNPDTEHTEISEKNLRYFVVHLADFEVIDKNKTPVKSLEISPRAYADVIELLGMAMDECKNASQNTPYLLSLLSAAYFLIRSIVTDSPAAAIVSGGISDGLSPTIRNCVNYVDIYYAETDILGELCKKFNLTRRNLERLFAKELNVSPLCYVKQVRMKQAEAMLSNSSYSVSRVAAVCGYSSFAYFSKEFKKRYGVSPSLYRAKKSSITP